MKQDKVIDEMKPHKHHDLIMAWRQGAAIQYFSGPHGWIDTDVPNWDIPTEYRVKPQPTPSQSELEITASNNFLAMEIVTNYLIEIDALTITHEGEGEAAGLNIVESIKKHIASVKPQPTSQEVETVVDEDNELIEVSAKALRELLVALIGEPHYIRELQVTRNPILFPDNPINILLTQFNEKATKG